MQDELINNIRFFDENINSLNQKIINLYRSGKKHLKEDGLKCKKIIKRKKVIRRSKAPLFNEFKVHTDKEVSEDNRIEEPNKVVCHSCRLRCEKNTQLLARNQQQQNMIHKLIQINKNLNNQLNKQYSEIQGWKSKMSEMQKDGMQLNVELEQMKQKCMVLQDEGVKKIDKGDQSVMIRDCLNKLIQCKIKGVLRQVTTLNSKYEVKGQNDKGDLKRKSQKVLNQLKYYNNYFTQINKISKENELVYQQLHLMSDLQSIQNCILE